MLIRVILFLEALNNGALSMFQQYVRARTEGAIPRKVINVFSQRTYNAYERF